jgi:hypothetical protein
MSVAAYRPYKLRSAAGQGTLIFHASTALVWRLASMVMVITTAFRAKENSVGPEMLRDHDNAV